MSPETNLDQSNRAYLLAKGVVTKAQLDEHDRKAAEEQAWEQRPMSPFAAGLFAAGVAALPRYPTAAELHPNSAETPMPAPESENGRRLMNWYDKPGWYSGD